MSNERFKSGDRVRVKKTGEIRTIESDYGPKFHPPYTVKEDGTMYLPEELERVGQTVYNVVFYYRGLLEPDPVVFSSEEKMITFFEREFGRKFKTSKILYSFLEKYNEKQADRLTEYSVFEIELDRAPTSAAE